MTRLLGYGDEIESVFSLLGKHENDITKAIAFTLSRCPEYLKLFLAKVLPPNISFDLGNVDIAFQKKEKDGITDIEIEQDGVFAIVIEAKRGFNLPGKNQLQKYADDLNGRIKGHKYIATLSDSMCAVAQATIPSSLDGISIKHIRYEDLRQLAQDSIRNSNRVESALLKELIQYLKGVINMRNLHSNTVYVVPISGENIKEHDDKRTYHCPVGKRFINYVPNYIGFRYGGKLQYINHVDDVEYYDSGEGVNFLFHLGPDIIPHEKPKTGGKYRGTKFYCDIDLLLTCSTIAEASRKTKERHK